MGSETGKGSSGSKQPWWLLYVGAVVGGAMLLADAFHYYPAQKISAKLGVGLIYSAFALFVANGKPPGVIATAVLWMALIVTFLV